MNGFLNVLPFLLLGISIFLVCLTTYFSGHCNKKYSKYAKVTLTLFYIFSILAMTSAVLFLSNIR